LQSLHDEFAVPDEEPTSAPAENESAQTELAETDPTATEPSDSQVHRYYVPFFQTGRSDDDFGDVGRLVLHWLQNRLDQVVTTAPSETEIDVWVDSPGGSASIAYKLFLSLQYRCRKLRMVVPDYAKSAATLLVLGADELFMGPAAELGPLDAQIEHPDREGIQVSALEVGRIFDFLGQFATDYVLSGGAEVLRWTKLARVEVLKQFSTFAAFLLRPAVGKLDPHLIYRAKNELDLAKQYAIRVLRKRRNPANRAFDPEAFADHIVGHYPVHEFVITRDEANEYGLGVKNAEDYDKWEYVYEIYRNFRLSLLVDEAAETLFDVWTEDELDEQMRVLSGAPGPEVANNSSEQEFETEDEGGESDD
jgi:hypothetical protein